MCEIIYPDLFINVGIQPCWHGHTGFIYIAKYSRDRKQIDLQDHRWSILFNCQHTAWHCQSKWHPCLLQGTGLPGAGKTEEYWSGSFHPPQSSYTNKTGFAPPDTHRGFPATCQNTQHKCSDWCYKNTAVMVCHEASSYLRYYGLGKRLKKKKSIAFGPQRHHARPKKKRQAKFCVVWRGLVCAT